MSLYQNTDWVKSFAWKIACDCLVDKYPNSDYRKIILPFIVLRRFDAVLEPTKSAVLKEKERLDRHGIKDQDATLCLVAKKSFCNFSLLTMKDLKSRTSKQALKQDFIAYLDGFTKNVQTIIDKFELRKQIDKLVDNDILGILIENFVSPTVNFSDMPILNQDGTIKIPALDNHAMGTAFESVVRMFNEETNITDAGRHFTPRDIVTLMADLAFEPVADKIQNNTYRVYDGACGTGGMLTVAEERIEQLAKKYNKEVSIHLYGQENADETFAIAQADMLIKGDGDQAENIFFGSTISNDGFAGKTFDFMISNPPFGTPWKTDLTALGLTKKEKHKMTDTRFKLNYDGDPDYSVLPNIGDPQMLFLANNIAKMKSGTELGSRIIEVHNGSSLFTGDAGGGESNLRRYIIENDLLECIVAMPKDMFYNTGIETFLWILSNKKPENRKGKIQLIDATSMKTPLRKNLGEKNCELLEVNRKDILKLYNDFENADPEFSKVFPNAEFGYYKIKVCRPLYDDNGNIIIEKKGKRKGLPAIDTKETDTEQVPLLYNGGINPVNEFYLKEIKPFVPDAWVEDKETIIGYELSFTKYFYKPIKQRELKDILADIKKLENETNTIMKEIFDND